MNYVGSKLIETERLILKAQTMDEQKKLWEILMTSGVYDYYLTTPQKFREKLKDWGKQKVFYEQKIEHAKDGNIFEWSIFLKDNGECIGKIDYHDRSIEDESVIDENIKGVGWYIDPSYQGKGYGTEAARATLDYMFNEVGIKEVQTGAAINNVGSWMIMEKIGMKRREGTDFVYYTYNDEPIEDYRYGITKEEYLEFISNGKMNSKL